MGQQCCGKSANPPSLEPSKKDNNLQGNGSVPAASYGRFEPTMMDNPYATVDHKAIEEAKRMQDEYLKSLNQEKKQQ